MTDLGGVWTSKTLKFTVPGEGGLELVQPFTGWAVELLHILLSDAARAVPGVAEARELPLATLMTLTGIGSTKHAAQAVRAVLKELATKEFAFNPGKKKGEAGVREDAAGWVHLRCIEPPPERNGGGGEMGKRGKAQDGGVRGGVIRVTFTKEFYTHAHKGRAVIPYSVLRLPHTNRNDFSVYLALWYHAHMNKRASNCNIITISALLGKTDIPDEQDVKKRNYRQQIRQPMETTLNRLNLSGAVQVAVQYGKAQATAAAGDEGYRRWKSEGRIVFFIQEDGEPDATDQQHDNNLIDETYDE